MDENLAQVMQSMSLEEDVPRDVKTDLMPAGFNGQSPYPFIYIEILNGLIQDRSFKSVY